MQLLTVAQLVPLYLDWRPNIGSHPYAARMRARIEPRAGVGVAWAMSGAIEGEPELWLEPELRAALLRAGWQRGLEWLSRRGRVLSGLSVTVTGVAFEVWSYQSRDNAWVAEQAGVALATEVAARCQAEPRLAGSARVVLARLRARWADYLADPSLAALLQPWLRALADAVEAGGEPAWPALEAAVVADRMLELGFDPAILRDDLAAVTDTAAARWDYLITRSGPLSDDELRALAT